MNILAIGPWQIITILIVLGAPVILFLLGFWLGKKSGYNKRIKEEQGNTLTS